MTHPFKSATRLDATSDSLQCTAELASTPIIFALALVLISAGTDETIYPMSMPQMAPMFDLLYQWHKQDCRHLSTQKRQLVPPEVTRNTLHCVVYILVLNSPPQWSQRPTCRTCSSKVLTSNALNHELSDPILWSN